MSLNALSSTAAALRAAFDRSFSEAQGDQREAYENFLAIRISGDPYAIRLAEIASLHVDRKIVALPSHTSHLLGLVGLRGALVPAYDLRVLLGYTAAASTGRWLLLVRAPEPVGLVFELFEAHLRIRAEDTSAAAVDIAKPNHVSGAAHAADGIRPIIQLGSLLQAIAASTDSTVPPEER